ncbi:serine/threonine-protein kinase [Sediminicoccus sp. KRV36]|uniref:serine/threonine-protein kinase n=1 Tax=Sediminicoccus sp. KRV36 TaxID=3133721 RepID=UPI00200FF7B7|nr:serine/threonine-protein kinase [Sediminicoccus rosea]UPY37357.1 serine/threonine-protein kinase [Sediminicoccus rosea]
MTVEMIGKYEIRGRLGAGAMGTVLDAFDPVIERRAALKIIPKPDAHDAEGEEGLARFKREAQAAGRLNHPNIVAVYDYGEDAERAWIAMELVKGGTLKQMLDRGERLPLAETLRVMEQMLAGLDYSHKRGVVHRDIKPANLMLTAEGQVKIADFGIARIENSSMTQIGTVMGTPAYMAPEQLRGETVDARADIWAAGVLLYQLLTGEKPFEGGYSAVMHKALHTEPTPPSALAVTAPRGFDAVIAKAMAKRPEDRFASASAFAEAIRLAAGPAATDAARGDDDATQMARPPPAARPAPAAEARHAEAGAAARKGPPLALIGGGVALAVAAGAAFLMLGDRAAPPPGNASQATADQQAGASEGRVIPPALRVLSRADFLAAAQAAAAAPACGLIASAASETGLVLEGVLRRGEDAVLRGVLEARAIPAAATTLALQGFEGPYCPALERVRPVLAAPGDAPRITLLGQAPLREGELLRFDVALPEWPTHLYVAYFMQSGEVAHLVPSATHPPGATVRLGDPRAGFPGWEVSEPFGTDLLLVLASEGPLFSATRPLVESQEAYLTALTEALGAARQAGRRVFVRPMVIETAAK